MTTAQDGGGPVDPGLVRLLDALRAGRDPGVFRAVGEVADPDEAPAAEARRVTPEPPPFDVSCLLGRFGVARLARRVDVSSWGPRFWSRLEDLRHRPPNWPDHPDPGQGLAAVGAVVAQGVPVVWAPSADVLTALLGAADRPERVAVLLAREQDVVRDCREVLAEVAPPALAGARWLAGRALDALGDGHPEAARALAVAVVEAAVERSLRGRSAQVTQQVLLDPDLAAYTAPRLRAGLAPVVATVAHADPAGSTRGDAVVAALVACSVLRTLTELTALTDLADLGELADRAGLGELDRPS